MTRGDVRKQLKTRLSRHFDYKQNNSLELEAKNCPLYLDRLINIIIILHHTKRQVTNIRVEKVLSIFRLKLQKSRAL